MKGLKLTPGQKGLYERLSSMKGAMLFKHYRTSGAMCYRLLDENKNPVANITCSLVDALISYDLLEIKDRAFVLKQPVVDEKKEMDISKLGFASLD